VVRYSLTGGIAAAAKMFRLIQTLSERLGEASGLLEWPDHPKLVNNFITG